MLINIAAYKFAQFTAAELTVLQQNLKLQCAELALKGTILLSVEGINLCLVGHAAAIATFKTALAAQHSALTDLHYKESKSTTQPFKRMLVKIKPEIITFKATTVQPAMQPAPYITPQAFAAWCKHKPDLLILDTRNAYEIKLGKFSGAIDLNLKNFSEFPQAAQALPAELRERPIVTYCTGGIRCEKAAAWMLQNGFKEVYQLEGGILNYFEQCGTAHYEGDCFVFDDRVALAANLTTEQTPQCANCQQVLTIAERQVAAQFCHTCAAA